MSEDNSALSVTLKAGPGYEAPWLNVRADDPETLRNRLNAVLNGDLASLVAQGAVALQAGYETVKTLGARPVAVVQDAVPAGPPQNVVAFPTPGQGFAQPAVAAVPAPSASETDKWGNVYTKNVPGAPTCPHGTRILKQGKKKNGEPFASYICPQVDRFWRVQTDCKPIYND